MATEVCDCGGTCSTCNPPFKPEGIRIVVTLEGTKGKDYEYGGGKLWNDCGGTIYLTENLSKRNTKAIIKKLEKIFNTKASVWN